MKGFLFGVSALLLAGLGPPQEPKSLSETITFDYEVGSIGGALESLSKATKVPMRVVGPAAYETVFLHVENRPLQEIMDKVASAVHAEWSLSKDGVYTLNRTTKQITEAQNQDYQQRLAILKKELSRKSQSLALKYDQQTMGQVVKEFVKNSDRIDYLNNIEDEAKEDPSNEIQKLEERNAVLALYDPTERVFARCIKDLDLATIVNLHVGQTVAFASKPNSVQLQLPSSALVAMDRLQADQLECARELRKYPTKIKYGDTVSRYEADAQVTQAKVTEYDLTSRGNFERSVPYLTKPSYALLSVTRSDYVSYDFNLKFFDMQGNLLLTLTYRPFEWEDYFNSEAPVNVRLKSPQPSEITELLAGLCGRDAMPQWQNFRFALNPFLADPNHRDMLWPTNQETLSSIAKAYRKSVIVCLPDEMVMDLGTSRWIVSKEGDEEDGWANYGRGSITRKESEGWVEFVPRNTFEHWLKKANRKAIDSLAKAIRGNGKGSMNDFLLTQVTDSGWLVPDAAKDFHSFLYPRLTKPFEFLTPKVAPYTDYSVTPNAAFISLMLSLTSEQYGVLEHGHKISYRELSLNQIELAQRIVFGDLANLWEGGTPPSPWAAYSPTLELPNGVLHGAGLSMEIAYDDLCMMYPRQPDIEDPTFCSVLDLVERKEICHEFVSFNCWTDAPKLPKANDFRYEFRKRKRITLKCFLTPGHYIAADFNEPMNMEKVRRYELEELPPNYLTKLKKSKSLDFKDGSDQKDQKDDPPVSLNAD